MKWVTNAALLFGLFVMLVTFPVLAHAQDSIKVIGFERLVRDLTASTKQVNDINGKPCGVIKIETNDSAFVFQPNYGVMDELFGIGERILYVPAGTKSITIRHPQYVMIRNYMLPETVESKATYLLKIDTEKRIQTTMLELKTNALEADVYVDDIIVGVTPFVGRIPSGQHTIVLRADRYQPAGKTINIQGSRMKLLFTLEQNKHHKYKSKYNQTK